METILLIVALVFAIYMLIRALKVAIYVWSGEYDIDNRLDSIKE